MMSIISSIVIGLIVGVLARALLPGDQKMGWILTCVLGVAGSLAASFAGQAMGWYAPGEPAGWFASVVTAVVLLFVVGKVRSSDSSS